MIFTNIAPNASFHDIRIISKFVFFPWKWKHWYQGTEHEQVAAWFHARYPKMDITLTDSGRSALYIGLKKLGLNKGDEIIVPAYTCIVVLNAIEAIGAVPIFVDIDTHTLNISIDQIRSALSPNTKAILVQHTFGNPCELLNIKKLCLKSNIYLIEDCAHALGSYYENTLVGSYGDISFFSFGSDKIVSSVRGGALIVKNTIVQKKIGSLQVMPLFILWQHIASIYALYILKKIYNLGGKIVLFLARKGNITASIITKVEKQGKMPSWTPAAYPNILTAVVFPQLEQLTAMHEKRIRIATKYYNDLPKEIQIYPQINKQRTYLHFPIKIENVKKFTQYMKKNSMQIGIDWNGSSIVPKNISKKYSIIENFNTANTMSKKIVQLPIHQNMTIKKTEKIIKLVKNYVSHV